MKLLTLFLLACAFSSTIGMPNSALSIPTILHIRQPTVNTPKCALYQSRLLRPRHSPVPQTPSRTCANRHIFGSFHDPDPSPVPASVVVQPNYPKYTAVSPATSEVEKRRSGSHWRLEARWSRCDDQRGRLVRRRGASWGSDGCRCRVGQKRCSWIGEGSQNGSGSLISGLALQSELSSEAQANLLSLEDATQALANLLNIPRGSLHSLLTPTINAFEQWESGLRAVDWFKLFLTIFAVIATIGETLVWNKRRLARRCLCPASPPPPTIKSQPPVQLGGPPSAHDASALSTSRRARKRRRQAASAKARNLPNPPHQKRQRRLVVRGLVRK
ncbi:hypothetical protein FPV67DRAFT_773862 [Lyophyllum atratum]|nr:hypothetical protein FPV67DRAFT_773862 [Lyophyllum atratum]